MTRFSRSAKTPVTLLAVAVGLALQGMAAAAFAQDQGQPAAPQSPPTEDAATSAPQTQAPPAATAAETPPADGTQADDGVQELERMEVTGIRQTQRTSTDLKREANVIVDALVSDEIGASPDLSVGETLERITGVTADRFKGSASEISVRGLGPFLGFSTFNGREVSSGSGDRAVSFQQFPSEIVNGVEVYKTQRPDLVEGGVSGVINLRTVRPLDYGEKRIQADIRGSYNEYAENAGDNDGLGFRGSFSAINQWDTGIGRIGAAIGYARIDSSAPEDFYTASSSFRPCNSVNPDPGETGGSNCSYDATSGNPVYFVGNQYGFRQLSTEDEREALIAALQWVPNQDWNINLDLQVSTRESIEVRHDLSLAEGRRGIAPTVLSDNGALLAWQGNSYLENVNGERDRDETYLGGGFQVEWRARENLLLSGDLSYSRTDRDQLDISTRLRSGRFAYTFDQRPDIPTLTFATPVDLDDHDLYSTNAYARRQSEERDDEITALRLDATLDVDRGWLTTLQAGVRYSEHERRSDPDDDNNVETIDPDATAAGQAACRLAFPQDDWGRDSDTNISSWAVFDNRCLYRFFTGVDDLGEQPDPRSAADLDISEDTTAAYLAANFSGMVGQLPFSGVLGVRAVRTDVTSRGFRGDYTVVPSGGGVTLEPIPGTFAGVTIRNRYTELLPSFNIAFELQDDLLLRGALYRAMARPNIEDMGAGREIEVDESAGTVEEAIAEVSGGNPRLEPLMSNNVDLSLEWYPNEDTTLALALYYKQLTAGIVPASENALLESFVIDGETYTVPVAQQTNSDRKRDLSGAELSVSHAMTWLPAPFDGFGFILGYNYADTNFEYEDPSATDNNNPLRNFTDPVGIIGLSRHSGSATLYYERENWSLRALYKYRSEYFKPFQLTANRIVDSAGFLDLSATYEVTDNVQLRFQALNVLNQEQQMFRPVEGSRAETSFFGTTYFVGLRLRF